MPSNYQNWQVLPRTRPALDRDSHGEPFVPRVLVEDRDGRWHEVDEQEEVVLIYDPRGPAYEVTVTDDEQGRARITSLTIHATPGQTLDHKALRAVPLAALAEVAAGHLDAYAENRAEGLDTAQAAALASATEPGDPVLRRSGSKPDLHEFAAVWNSTRYVVADQGTPTRRKAVAAHFGIPLWLVDKRAREARDLGLIQRSTVGRPRKPKSDPTKRTPTIGNPAAHTTTKKEQKP